MEKPLSLWGDMVPLILEDVIIIDTATEAATDWYVWMDYSSGDKVMDTLHRCLLLQVGQVYACADDRCSSGYVVSMCLSKPLLLCYWATAITDGGDAVGFVNPTTLLKNDDAVASLACAIVGNSKVMLVCTSEYNICTGCYTMNAKQVINTP